MSASRSNASTELSLLLWAMPIETLLRMASEPTSEGEPGLASPVRPRKDFRVASAYVQ